MRSFRDPDGILFPVQGRLIRIVGPGAALGTFLHSKAAQQFSTSDQIAHTRVLDCEETAELLQVPEFKSHYDALGSSLLVEHERIPFVSYPYEWPAEMLHAAGLLTLDLAQKLLPEGLGLKDATPYNILFRGPQPVFVDLLSFERRDPENPLWLPYAQFVRTFLLPLLANKYLNLPLDQVMTTRRDGLDPEEIYRYLGPFRKLIPPCLTLVTIPKWLSAGHNQDDTRLYEKKSSIDPEKARFILDSLLNRQRATLNRLAPPSGRHSTWSDYMVSGNNNYAERQFSIKDNFVAEVIREFAPKTVLDVGCNTGHFSVAAARGGAQVVAIDYDPVVVGQLWRQARAERLDILPLVVNLARPTPATGWRNEECASFLERARGRFDAVFMLALVHHLLVTERVPLPDIMDLAAELTREFLVIEYIGPQDSMFRRLTRGRDELHKNISLGYFESICSRRFEIIRSQPIEGGARSLYLLYRKRDA